MDNSLAPNREGPQGSSPNLDAAVKFLSVLFAKSDTILLRPIETWVEVGRKRSKVDYRHTSYRQATPEGLRPILLQLLKLADAKRLNLFFGVCPRFGDKCRFDLAFQIRTARALWCDIDNVGVTEAIERLAKGGLPPPSLSVNSGYGMHFYWLLDHPYQIDDSGDPPAVEIEWTESREGRKKPWKYIVESGDRVYLDKRPHVARLSAKAQHFQDVLAGIARACGGDHTTDLSRLLRLPGTFNRKDQRNGREPVPCSLLEFDPTRKYSLATFESLKASSPESARAVQIAGMPLPKPRKATATRSDKLAELVAASSVAQPGCRSEADFSLCCYAIRNGISKEHVWELVRHVGKFAEQGLRYFELTWEKAEFDVRVGLLDKLQHRTGPKDRRSPSHEGNTDGELHSVTDDAVDGPSKIVVNSATMPVGETLRQVTETLLATGNCFTRAEQLVVIRDQHISPILSPPELAGLLNEHVQFYFVFGDMGQYKPLTPAYANTWLNHHIERARLPAIKLFTRNPVFTDDWRLLAPGFDEQSGICYAGPAIEARSDTEHLDTLLLDFCFKSPADRTNYIGILLTALLIPRFIGSKPAALFNGNQPGLGKTILAQIIATIRDGHVVETATYNPNDEEFEKRIGAMVHRGVTTIIIDNAKGQRRNRRIESACLERTITDPILSFRLLGYSREIRAENSLIVCITANTPDVGPDLVSRSAVINLHHEGDPLRRSFAIENPEGYAAAHRNELLGELIGMVERWKAARMPNAHAPSRFNKQGWGSIVGGILDANGEPDFLANAEEAALLLDETRREFAELVNVLVDHPQGNWTASELVDQCSAHRLLAEDLGDGSPHSKSTKMGTIAGRFNKERFALVDGRWATFHRTDGRKGKIYQVFVEDNVPNLDVLADPLPNLTSATGSAY